MLYLVSPTKEWIINKMADKQSHARIVNYEEN